MTSNFTHNQALLLATLLACCSISNAAESNELLFEAKAEESVRVRVAGGGDEDHRTIVEKQKVEFHHVALWGTKDGGPDRQVIAKETIREVMDHAHEGVESNLRVDLFFAKENMGKFPTKPTQTVEIPDAHEAEFEDEFWTATTLGCCDAEPYSRMYAYGSDRPFLRYNEEFWKVEVPNARPLTRYVGMVLRAHVPNEAAAEAIFGKQKRAVAAVSLAEAGKLLDTVYLVPKDGIDPENLALHSEKLELRGTGPKDEQHAEVHLVTMWSLDGAEEATAAATTVKGVIVQAGLYVDDGSTETLHVEIRDDKFVDAKVTGKKLRAVTRAAETAK